VKVLENDEIITGKANLFRTKSDEELENEVELTKKAVKLVVEERKVYRQNERISFLRILLLFLITNLEKKLRNIAVAILCRQYCQQ
jgi:hypothetical protein